MRPRLRILALALALATAAPTWAGSFVATPVRADLSASARSAVITVTNTEDAPLTIQLRTMKWTQRDGRDVHEASSDLLATPTVFSLEPNASQVIRIALRKPGDAALEGAYRLYIEEVPQSDVGGGIQVALRMSLPVFVKPATERQGELAWQAERSEEGVKLRATNTANTHARVLDLHTVGADGKAGDSLALAYILAGQQRSWSLPASVVDAEAQLIRLRAITDHGPVAVDVPVESN